VIDVEGRRVGMRELWGFECLAMGMERRGRGSMVTVWEVERETRFDVEGDRHGHLKTYGCCSTFHARLGSDHVRD